MKKAFTLIELLVVIAIIAILAAILFPVFAQAKLQAKKASDLSNIKQIALSTLIYTNDSDDVLLTPVDPCLSSTLALTTCSTYGTSTNRNQSAGLSGQALNYLFWTYKLQPYTKNFGIFKSNVDPEAFTSDTGTTIQVFNAPGTIGPMPEASGNDWGGSNSYGYNSFFLSPITGVNTYGPTYAPVTSTSSPRVATTFLYTDATFHVAAPDVLNYSGYTYTTHLINTSGSYESNEMTDGGTVAQWAKQYWQNVSNGDYTIQGDPGQSYAPTAINKGLNLFAGKVNASFLDSHAKTMSYQQVVGDVCYWSIDLEGAHPLCN